MEYLPRGVHLNIACICGPGIEHSSSSLLDAYSSLRDASETSTWPCEVCSVGDSGIGMDIFSSLAPQASKKSKQIPTLWTKVIRRLGATCHDVRGGPGHAHQADRRDRMKLCRVSVSPFCTLGCIKSYTHSFVDGGETRMCFNFCFFN